MDAPGAQDSAYNRAVQRGRHPRSFGRTDTCHIWSTLKTSSSRVVSVKTGQGLGNVVAKEIEALHSGASSPAETPSAPSPSRATLKEFKAAPLLAGLKDRAKRPGKKKLSSHDDVIRKIQALGAATGVPSNNSPATTEVDTSKLRQDFSSQKDARVYYGSTAALELFTGDLLMVSVADAAVCVQPLERLKHQPKGARDKLLFTLINMNELRSANPIRFGDSVWLQISVGTGESSWEQGGVLGAKVRKAPDLQTLSLTPSDMEPGEPPVAAADEVLLNVGLPVPVKAYLPKTRDDSTDSQIDDMQARLRNKTSRMVGRWIVRSAVVRPKSKDEFVYNDDEIYLEQDWFYLAADSEPSETGIRAVLRQLPPTKTTKVGEYVVERRAAWKVRLVDSSNGGLGLSLVQQQMERLLFKAKTQLKASEKMRDGQLRQYGPNLSGGQGFSKQLRRHIQTVTAECDDSYFAHQNERLRHLDQYFEGKMADMDKTHRKHAPLSPLASSLTTSLSAPALSSAFLDSVGLNATASLSTLPPTTEKICNLCVANARVGFNLCVHDHEVAHCVAMGTALPAKNAEPSLSPEAQKAKSVTERHLSTSEGAMRAARAIEAAEIRERGRIMRLLAEQDDRLVNVIKYTEQRAHLAAIASHSSDVDDDAASFFGSNRSRVRRRLTGLVEESSPRRRSTVKVEPHVDPVATNKAASGAAEERESTLQETGGSGDDDSGDDDDDDFITEDEIQTLEYINVAKANVLYANDEKAMLEMLRGFADLAEHRIVPQLQDALAARQKACLLETSDFLARAAEFVMARRIQVHVMSLIQCVATSNVDDFTAITPAVDQLVLEIQGTVQFIRSYDPGDGLPVSM
ncbi:hypothetical protein ACHHYP_13678 [Achlya hypogyna]|uniref:Uncharacterized protein n=1 Tax=Achlya hypogyna TaxID=1202772 RepID=A0A1V9YEX0_ACHHY|nr:hypothetical protein ACHHYP_13678 [Achlya hypogyna]